jgi:hypothetical protein
MALFNETSQNRRSSFELWALKQQSKMSPQAGLSVQTNKMRLHECICTPTRKCIYVYMHTHTQTCIYTYTYIYTCTYTRIHAHTYTYACICTPIYRQKISAKTPHRVKQYHRRTHVTEARDSSLPRACRWETCAWVIVAATLCPSPLFPAAPHDFCVFSSYHDKNRPKDNNWLNLCLESLYASLRKEFVRHCSLGWLILLCNWSCVSH